MDEIARYNKKRWEELARNRVVFARPFLDLNAESARRVVDAQGLLGDITGKDVLCLASGGGQQSAAFGLLGANVTVFDLSETQLERDREAAAFYGLTIRTVQGDMRDLSCFADDSFDLVWHAFSLSFVPDPMPVLHEARRVLRLDGLYCTTWANPFVAGIDEADWTGEGYPLRHPYVEGAELTFSEPDWEIWDDDGNCTRVKGPREFRHTLSTMINGLIGLGFVILGLWEDPSGDPNAEPGTWEHFTAIAPPWLTVWAAYRPNLV